jgi:molybdate transport system ATP-binding protein
VRRLEAIRLVQTSVRLGRHWALRDVTLEIRAGQRWLLEGANGAGKTVLLKLLRGDFWPTPTGRERREYRLDGHWQDQPLLARDRIAYLGPERQDRYDRHGLDARVADVVATGLTGEDLLLEEPSAAQWREVHLALADVGLAGRATRRFLTLSYGQRRRVLLARALVGRPDVLLLDEPLNGLDPAGRRAFLGALRRRDARETTWVLATHRPGDRPPGVTDVAHLERGRLRVEPSQRRGSGTAARRGHDGRPAVPARTDGSVAPLVALHRVRVYRDQGLALGPLDWSLGHGEHWHVAGPNGAGKSTLVALLYGDFAPAVGGRILRHGMEPGAPIEEWKRRVGLVSPELQSTYAATGCTAEEIVLSGLSSSIGLDEPPTAAQRRRARHWLGRVGLESRASRRARELSYGQLRLALAARALVAPRRLLLFDEPFEGLDADARGLLTALTGEAVAGGAQLVVATHHVQDVPAYVTRRLELSAGRVRNGAGAA